MDLLDTFYEEHFSDVIVEPLVLSDNLTQIINYSCVTMLTNIENNITMHFEKRFKRTIFEYCFDKQKEGLTVDEYKALPKTRKKLLRDIAKRDAKSVQDDIFNLVLPLPDDSIVNPDQVILLSHPDYHSWIRSIGVTFITPYKFPVKDFQKERTQD